MARMSAIASIAGRKSRGRAGTFTARPALSRTTFPSSPRRVRPCWTDSRVLSRIAERMRTCWPLTSSVAVWSRAISSASSSRTMAMTRE
jgi:hypothetical protein